MSTLACRLVGVLALLSALGTPAAGQTGTGQFTGTVLDSLRRPVPNAEVSLPALSLTTQTSDDGAFRVTGIAAGLQRVVVRRVGFGQLDTTINFASGAVVVRQVTLKGIPTLDSVIVVAPVDPIMAEFENDRKRGFGHFITRADLDKMGDRPIGNSLTRLPGLDIVRGRGGEAWITGKHAPPSGCHLTRLDEDPRVQKEYQDITDRCLRQERVLYVPDPGEESEGVVRACYARVYQDRALMNPGKPASPFDINTIPANQLEGIEWFESASQTPPRLGAVESHCGVAILYTRRAH